jgi:hypothetical protein
MFTGRTAHREPIGAFYVIIPPLAALLIPALITCGLWALLGGVRLFQLGRPLAEG